MSRLRADLFLLLAAIIWGAAFVAQKDAFNHIGPFSFVAARSFLACIVVLPVALRERKRKPRETADFQAPALRRDLGVMLVAFSLGVIFQQVGIGMTSVTSAGFLTGLYVVFAPLLGYFVYKEAIPSWIALPVILSIAGTWFLSGGVVSAPGGFNTGDVLVIICAVFFAMHVILIGRIMAKVRVPLQVSCLQYGVAGILALIGALATESHSLSDFIGAAIPILYAGAMSGGVAYTLQVIAQQYTPPSDSAIILSSEAVFAAVFGFLLLGDRLSPEGLFGCVLITLSILVVELAPYVLKRFRQQ
jgi:drug/metabolite transporter (DMT)-like permease